VRSIRRFGLVAATLLLALALPPHIARAGRFPLRLSSPHAAPGSGASSRSSDFNGDGYADAAIGAPYEDLGTGESITAAGGVEVLYGSSTAPHLLDTTGSQFWTQDSTSVKDQAESGDHFGASLAFGDFDGDGYDDLAIGVPDEDIVSGGSTIKNAGAVDVLYGSSSGLSASRDQFWTQNSSNIEDAAEKGDKFGSSLTAWDFSYALGCTSGDDDLAVGVPNEDLSGTKTDAGAVNVIYGSPSGLNS